MRESRNKTEADIKYNSHKLDDVTASSAMMEGMNWEARGGDRGDEQWSGEGAKGVGQGERGENCPGE